MIHNTHTDHTDYLNLNIALSKLETVAHQLNERKRSSEKRLAASVILSKLLPRNTDHSDSILLRQDDVTEIVSGRL